MGEAIQAFDILKAKSGSRSGPRLAAEMIDLLLIEHGEKPVGPLRSCAAKYPKVISHGVAVYVPKPNPFGTGRTLQEIGCCSHRSLCCW